mmetsp:Transcript_66894/g.206841  ORF Transcript_66894/g.206841 Transcript_66894/m.206841 type:complete len:205 (-) Transcript_66894:165-779(-)
MQAVTACTGNAPGSLRMTAFRPTHGGGTTGDFARLWPPRACSHSAPDHGAVRPHGDLRHARAGPEGLCSLIVDVAVGVHGHGRVGVVALWACLVQKRGAGLVEGRGAVGAGRAVLVTAERCGEVLLLHQGLAAGRLCAVCGRVRNLLGGLRNSGRCRLRSGPLLLCSLHEPRRALEQVHCGGAALTACITKAVLLLHGAHEVEV